MKGQRTPSRQTFIVSNYFFLSALSLLCILPLVHVLAVSLSSSAAATAGQVNLWPVDFTLKSYRFVASNPAFLEAFFVTLQRVGLGIAVNMLLVLLTAYPLSKETKSFRARTWMVWLFVFTMLFNGGLIPTYMTIKYTHLLDSIWALVIPGAVPVFSVILLINFFRGLPKELEEASFIDGAGHWKALWSIYAPLSLPALATIALLTIVGHWNSWFDGLIYMNSRHNYPLSSYLQTIIIQRDLSNVTLQEMKELSDVSDRTMKAAQIFLGALPILVLYPFLQKYFVKGIVLGSVKE
ncbi:carbohydrate ABC transporter permease [Cohnella sp. LGH]|uniref:carbohydrate ABC transporter permease n=1 Tax=Cohnella sp. LGH TaxID=1619153 RepID=UPI001ADC8E6E|nr:carbohydrate ABC transporter permease [Cohnella sp. LGH]QTH43812.1 carbohydrate ABC transporter permease [Cohnella sp. LGH]